MVLPLQQPPPLLTHKNFLLYCASRYDNPSCTGTDEFLADMARIKHLKKLLTRYIRTGDLKHRLILNHLIVIHNLWGAEATVRILYLKMRDYMKYLAPFLVAINIMPVEEPIWNVGEPGPIYPDEIPLDQAVVRILRKELMNGANKPNL